MSRHNFKLGFEHMEQVSKKPRVSKTVPDDTLSLQEILTRFVHNAQAMDELSRKPTGYSSEDPTHDSPDLSEIARMDAMEKADYARQLKQEITEQVDGLKKAREKARIEFKKNYDLQYPQTDKSPSKNPNESGAATKAGQKAKASPKPAQDDPKTSGQSKAYDE